jgi:hypothetical protein
VDALPLAFFVPMVSSFSALCPRYSSAGGGVLREKMELLLLQACPKLDELQFTSWHVRSVQKTVLRYGVGGPAVRNLLNQHLKTQNTQYGVEIAVRTPIYAAELALCTSTFFRSE